uniref:Plastid ribosomal protein L21 n=1 Tax=Chlamydomonas leiostraca TaxID=1034604 RepID=A0A7S0WM06_9CHLO
MQCSSLARTGVRPFTAVRPVAVARRPVVCQAQAAAVKEYHPSPLSQAPPSTYAVVEVGGTQLFVEPGKWYTVNRLKADVGAKIKFGRVLALKHEGKLAVGQPYLEKVNVEAEVIEELRGPKVIVYKMKPKKHYRRKRGHRQDLSKFRVTKIEA